MENKKFDNGAKASGDADRELERFSPDSIIYNRIKLLRGGLSPDARSEVEDQMEAERLRMEVLANKLSEGKELSLDEEHEMEVLPISIGLLMKKLNEKRLLSPAEKIELKILEETADIIFAGIAFRKINEEDLQPEDYRILKDKLTELKKRGAIELHDFLVEKLGISE